MDFDGESLYDKECRCARALGKHTFYAFHRTEQHTVPAPKTHGHSVTNLGIAS